MASDENAYDYYADSEKSPNKPSNTSIIINNYYAEKPKKRRKSRDKSLENVMTQNEVTKKNEVTKQNNVTKININLCSLSIVNIFRHLFNRLNKKKKQNKVYLCETPR